MSRYSLTRSACYALVAFLENDLRYSEDTVEDNFATLRRLKWLLATKF
jgi:hypothetical protein